MNYEEIYSMQARIKGGAVYSYRWAVFRGTEDDLYHENTEEIPFDT